MSVKRLQFWVRTQEYCDGLLVPLESCSEYELAHVFFRPDVLSRYHFRPSRYEIEQNYIKDREGRWILQSLYRAENKNARFVHCYFYDLSILPEDEIDHWHKHNIDIMHKDFYSVSVNQLASKRDLHCSFEDAPRDYIFYLMQQLHVLRLDNKSSLFNLTEELNVRRNYMQLPLVNEDSHYQAFILRLSISTVENLKPADAWLRHLGIETKSEDSKEKLQRSLSVLKGCLIKLGVSDQAIQEIIVPLRALYAERSKIVHGNSVLQVDAIPESEKFLKRTVEALSILFDVLKVYAELRKL